jgi:uroporphyrinogen III methyltransferase/synthase
VAETEDNLDGIERLKEEGADVITVTSASTVEHFLALGVPLPEGIRTASIGPVTSAEMKKRGLKVDVEAKEHTIPGLVKAVREMLVG